MGFFDDIAHILHLGGGGTNGPHGGTAPVADTGFQLPSGGLGGGLSMGGGFQLPSGAGFGGGQENPITDAQSQVQKELGYMQGNPGLYQQGANVAAGKSAGHGGWLGNVIHDIGSVGGHALTDTLNILDLPRDTIVSTLDQLTPHSQGYVKDFNSHIGFGHVLNDMGVKSGLVRSLGGITGDVALDPLTYLGGLGEVAKGIDLGGKALAAAGDATKAAEAIRGGGDLGKAVEGLQAGHWDVSTLGRLHMQGVAGLNDTEKEALGLKSGVRFGTKAAHVQLLPSAATDPLSRAVHQLGFNVRAAAASKSLAAKVIPHQAIRQSMYEALKTGDFGAAHGLSQTLKASSLIPGVRQAFLNTHGHGLSDSINAFKPEEHSDALRALEGKGPLVGDERVTNLRGQLDKVAGDLQGRGVEMGRLENYAPHQLTDAARNLGQTGKGASRSAWASELSRTLNPGDYFLGHQLNDASIEEINQVMEHEGFQHKLFKDSLPEVADTYLHGAANRAGMQEFANRLGEMGLTRSGEEAKAPTEWMMQLAEAKHNLNAGKHAAGQTAAKAEKLNQRIDELQARHTKAPDHVARAIIGSKQRDAIRELNSLQSPDLSFLENEVKRLQSMPKPTGEDVSLGAKGAFGGKEGPQYIKDALAKLAEEQSAHAANAAGAKSGFGKYMDKWLATWRNYALAMPGKAIRHTIAGPAWGHYIGQVKLADMPHSMAIWKQYTKGGLDAVKDPADRQTLEKFLNQGLNHGHGFHTSGIATEDVDKGSRIVQAKGAVKSKAAYNPLSSDFAYFKGNRELQARAQDYSRFAMFRDAMKNHGLDDLSAGSKVRSILGDPGNLTDWERTFMRRVVPFYAFLRTQMPAQIKAMGKHPSKFLNFINAENEVGDTQKRPGLVPGYFGQDLAFQSPIGGSKNNPLFLSPDLPFTRMNELFSQPLSQLNPLAQMYLEKVTNANPQTGAQFSPNAKPLPGVLDPISSILNELGFAQPQQQTQSDYGNTTTKGTEMITPAKLDQFENMFPMASQLVDLFSGANKPGGGTAGDITNLVGAFRGYQDNPTVQSDVLWARYFALQQMIKSAQNVGALPPYIPGYKSP